MASIVGDDHGVRLTVIGIGALMQWKLDRRGPLTSTEKWPRKVSCASVVEVSPMTVSLTSCKGEAPIQPPGASPLWSESKATIGVFKHLQFVRISVIARGGDLVTSTPVTWGFGT